MNIAILCPDTFPLLLSNPDTIISNKCCDAGALGKRAYQIINDISEHYVNNNIDVYIPNYNFPQEKIEGPFFTDTHVNYISYNFKKGVNLEDLVYYNSTGFQIKKYDYIIIQTSAGVNFKVVTSVLRKIGTKVIVDAWVPFLQEQDVNLKRYGSRGDKKYRDFQYIFSNLLERADMILYDNNSQLNYLQGYLQALGLRIEQIKLIHYKYNPFSGFFNIDCYNKTKKKKVKNLLWFGPIYPWYDIEKISCFVMLHKRFNLLFYGARHPRYFNYYDSTIREKLISYSQYCENIALIEHFQNSIEEYEILLKTDAVVIFDNGGIESKYAVRTRILDLLAKGIIVITNSNLEGIDLKDGLYKIDNSYEELETVLTSKLSFSNESYLKFSNLFYTESIKDIIQG